jgi:putative PIN family toxin of toxin-antitoxin system
MIRVVLDTNTIVSAQLKPSGLEATVLLLALRGDITLLVSPPILAEYQRVLYKPKLKFDHRRVEAVLLDIGAASKLVHPTRTLADAKHEPDNRFLECAEVARADYLITGNKRHFPTDWKPSKIVNTREFISQTALLDLLDS